MNQATLKLTRLAILLALMLTVQMLGLPQVVTGPLINFFLILAVIILDLKAAVSLGVISPLIALWRGQLPPVLAPMLPFIMIGNSLLAATFWGLRQTGQCSSLAALSRPFRIAGAVLAICVSAGIKFIWLYAAVTILLPWLLQIHFSPPIIFLMTTPQFFTALIGGILALMLAGILPRLGIIKK